jgi:hypothetical protein
MTVLTYYENVTGKLWSEGSVSCFLENKFVLVEHNRIIGWAADEVSASLLKHANSGGVSLSLKPTLKSIAYPNPISTSVDTAITTELSWFLEGKYKIELNGTVIGWIIYKTQAEQIYKGIREVIEFDPSIFEPKYPPEKEIENEYYPEY